jgi:FtsP/CotA-like multicopper oxidase with cupredoxin domain
MVTRRKFLYLLGGSATASFLSACRPGTTAIDTTMATATSQPVQTTATAVFTPTAQTDAPTSFVPDVEITLRAILTEHTFQDESPTQMLKYRGTIEKGGDHVLQEISNSYLGPTINVQRGQKVRLTLLNELPMPTIIHWHGLHLPEEMDGHPQYAIEENESYVYEFEVTNRAGTYWYHPHPHQMTGGQVYYGLAGLFLIHDEVEAAYNLPTGEYDLPLVIQDRTFNADNQLQYVDNGHQMMVGYWANTLLVNGQLNYQQEVATSAYRLRLLNGSNARIYKLAWSDGSPLTVIGTDGGLLDKPTPFDYVVMAPAERVELWVDFSQDEIGTSRTLQALPFDGGNAETVNLIPFIVTQAETHSFTLPSAFAPLAFHEATEAVNLDSPRTFNFFVNHMTPTIDGRVFEMDSVTDEETVKLDTLEVWELTNDMNQSGIPHPIHVHGLQFQVLERTVNDSNRPLWESVNDGYVDSGWKDTVLLMPGERVRILLKFEDYKGTYLYHCHNLEHEDGGMMRNFQITA